MFECAVCRYEDCKLELIDNSDLEMEIIHLCNLKCLQKWLREDA